MDDKWTETKLCEAIERLKAQLKQTEAQRDKLLHWERHTGPDECPSWHDTCHCSPDTCKGLWDQLDVAERERDEAQVKAKQLAGELADTKAAWEMVGKGGTPHTVDISESE
jgi:hypothetical protein